VDEAFGGAARELLRGAEVEMAHGIMLSHNVGVDSRCVGDAEPNECNSSAVDGDGGEKRNGTTAVLYPLGEERDGGGSCHL